MLNKFKSFLRDSSGNIMIMSAFALMPLLLAAGVAIDTAERYRATQSYQAAVDAAALAAAKVLSETGDDVKAKSYGANIFQANIANLPHSQGTIDIDTGNGDCSGEGVVANATLRHPMFFDGFHKLYAGKGDANHLNVGVSSTVKCGNDTIEIALVLDNSGSMDDDGKIDALKDAASELVESLHESMSGSNKIKPLQFSIVPFSAMVNIGDNNKARGWMDKTGRSSIHHEHLDWSVMPGAVSASKGRYKDASGNFLTRFSLYDELGIDWAGCVEQRPYPYHTNDEKPVNANGDTLFVPSFAPDTPDNFTNQRELSYANNSAAATKPYCEIWQNGNQGRCYRWSDGYIGSYHPDEGYAQRYNGDYNSNGLYIAGGVYLVQGNNISEETYENNYLSDAHNTPHPMHAKNPVNSGTGTGQYSRQKWTFKYFNGADVRDVNRNRSGIPTVANLRGGPNAWCTAAKITDLTRHKHVALDGISSMVAEGATNVQQGIAWGWRTLSSDKPFTRGRDYSVKDNKKIMIVMTDGNNTYYPMDEFNNVSTRNPAYYAAFGHNGGEYGGAKDLPKRLFEGFDGIASANDTMDSYRQAMDEHTAETCENAKSAGIQVYSIAFDVPNGSSVKQTLQQCSSLDASGDPLYFDARDNDELAEAFKTIEQKITALTIAK